MQLCAGCARALTRTTSLQSALGSFAFQVREFTSGICDFGRHYRFQHGDDGYCHLRTVHTSCGSAP